MVLRSRKLMHGLLLSAALAATHSLPAFAAETHDFSIRSPDAAVAIHEFGAQAGVQILASGEQLKGKRFNAVAGTLSTDAGMRRLLDGTGLTHRYVGYKTVALVQADQANSRSAVASGETVPQSRASDAVPARASETTRVQATVQELLDEVIVTGTRFDNRTVIESPVPVDVFSAKELRASGYSDLPSMLQAVEPSFSFPPTSTNGGSSFVRRATVRGLSFGQTLVLVNGKRRHLGILTGAAGADFNSILPNAIGRVEVLRDGASAQYGSDAIGGVYNIILRDDLGAEVTTTYGQTDEGDGELREISANGGLQLGAEGFLHIALYSRESEMTNRQGFDVRQQYFGFRSGAPIVFPTVSPSDNTPVLQPGDTFDPRESTIDRLNTNRQGDPDRSELGVMFNGRLPLGESHEIYTFGEYMQRKIDTPFVWRRPLDNNTVRAIFPDGYQPIMHGEVTDASLNVGVKGSLGAWDYDISEGWGRNNTKVFPRNTLNPSMGLDSPTSFYVGDYPLQQAVTNLDLRRQVDLGWQQPLSIALGAEYRWDNFQQRAGDPEAYIYGGVPVLDGPFAGATTAAGSQGFGGIRPLNEVDVSRDNVAAYTQLETEFFDRLLVDLAGRFEHYSDAGDTTDGKLALRWKLNDVFALRGSASTGFRAPSLGDSYYTTTSSTFVQGVSQLIRRLAPTDPIAQLLGATPLKPEESVSYSLGITAEPTQNLFLTVDFYETSVDNQIVTSSLFNDQATRDFLVANGITNVTGAGYLTNAIDAKVKGIDVTGRYQYAFDNSRLTFTTALNFNDREITRVAETPASLAAITPIPLFDRQQLLTYSRGVPRTTLNFSLLYDVANWEFFARTIKYGGIVTGFGVPAFDQEFGAKWLTDVSARFNWNDKLSITAGLNNAFDVYPDEQTPLNNPAGTNKYSAASPFGFNGRFAFLRAQLRF